MGSVPRESVSLSSGMGMITALLEAGANPLLEDWNGYSSVTRADSLELRDMLQSAAIKGGFKSPGEEGGNNDRVDL